MTSVSFLKDKKSGRWDIKTVPLGTNNDYLSSFLDTLNEIEPIFEKAQTKSEFYFVFSLLSINSSQGAGWDPYETVLEVKKSFLKAQKKLRYSHNSRAYYSLFLYGLIIEASEYYERLGNLLEICLGKPYRTDVVTTGVNKKLKRIQLYPKEKIERLKLLAEEVGFKLNIFDTFFDNHLRNSIFHSAFVIHEKEVRTLNLGNDRVYPEKEILRLFNRVLGYSDAFDFIIDSYKKGYSDPVKIPVALDFASFPGEMAQIIIRKNHGLIGIKADCEPGNINGIIDWRLARTLRYEQTMIEEGVYILPEDRFDRINRIINLFPDFLHSVLVKLVRKNKLINHWLE